MRSTCNSSFVMMIFKGASRVHVVSGLFFIPILWKDHLFGCYYYVSVEWRAVIWRAVSDGKPKIVK